MQIQVLCFQSSWLTKTLCIWWIILHVYGDWYGLCVWRSYVAKWLKEGPPTCTIQKTIWLCCLGHDWCLQLHHRPKRGKGLCAKNLHVSVCKVFACVYMCYCKNCPSTSNNSAVFSLAVTMKVSGIRSMRTSSESPAQNTQPQAPIMVIWGKYWWQVQFTEDVLPHSTFH